MIMLYHSLKTLDELNAIEAQEKVDVSSLLEAEPLDPGLAVALETFDTANPFWATFTLPLATITNSSSYN